MVQNPGLTLTGLLDRVARSRSQGTSPAEKVEKRERDQHVIAALGRLDAEYRAVLVMRDIEGFDYQQMADTLIRNGCEQQLELLVDSLPGM